MARRCGPILMIDPETLPYRPCVGVMLINADGLVFGGQRLDNPVPAWQMPQGSKGTDDGQKTESHG